jgi:hypothetical protein
VTSPASTVTRAATSGQSSESLTIALRSPESGRPESRALSRTITQALSRPATRTPSPGQLEAQAGNLNTATERLGHAASGRRLPGPGSPGCRLGSSSSPRLRASAWVKVPARAPGAGHWRRPRFTVTCARSAPLPPSGPQCPSQRGSALLGPSESGTNETDAPVAAGRIQVELGRVAKRTRARGGCPSRQGYPDCKCSAARPPPGRGRSGAPSSSPSLGSIPGRP